MARAKSYTKGNFHRTHYITFSCYQRRKLLDSDTPTQIVMNNLADQLIRKKVSCLAFVIMPNHVHAILHLPIDSQLSPFVQQWKRISSFQIKKWYQKHQMNYWKKVPDHEPIWQDGYHAFPIIQENTLFQKQKYIHDNPVRAGLVTQPTDWQYSSARWEMLGKEVGVPLGWNT